MIEKHTFWTCGQKCSVKHKSEAAAQECAAKRKEPQKKRDAYRLITALVQALYEYKTVREIAELTGLHVTTVRSYLPRKRFPATPEELFSAESHHVYLNMGAEEKRRGLKKIVEVLAEGLRAREATH